MTPVKYFDQPLPDNFRQNDIADILKIVSRGESLQLVAPSGSGKSLLLQQLTEKSTKDLTIIALDFNLLADKTPANTLAFLDNNLTISGGLTKASPLPSPVYTEEVSARGRLMKTVIIMDHFENILNSNMKDFLNYLKGYYVKNRPNISYIFATEQPILETNFLFLSGNLSSVLTENVYLLPPLCQKDVDWIIKVTASHYQLTLTKAEKETIAYQSAGYLRIIKYLIHAMSTKQDLNQIIANPTLDLHLSTFMRLLTEKTAGLNGFALPPIFQNLSKSQITLAGRSLGEGWPIYSNQFPIEEKLHLNQSLTKSEAKVAQFLLKNKSLLVSREETAQAVWGVDAGLDYTDHALDQLISRLNKKLALVSPPISITTLRGRGYRLSLG